MKKDLRILSQKELEDLFLDLKQPKFRAKQLYDWLWNKGLNDIELMTNLPKDLRKHLSEHYEIRNASIAMEQKSIDGTIKLAFNLYDNRLIEGVLIPSDKRMTACVSSQVGCTLSCAFCATGMIKRERNLGPGEIYDQVVLLNQKAQENYNLALSNIVFMGMGEPLLNYDNVMSAIDKITSPSGLGMAPRRITLSTVGIARGIKRLADEGKAFKLAWSLHAPSNEKRDKIMGINKSNSIEEVIEALQYFYQKTGNKITYEYIIFEDFNDSLEDAKDLLKLCRQVPAFVNIIEYNQVEGVVLNKAKKGNRDAFIKYLETNGVTAKVRISRGEDIDAACGQLANK
ncbi:MAG: 23S rRNA (adenine(2503)-C(2))-methyltransferase RlmN [Chitinophagales bacterium]|nr:23S rRNA (adenine(2503)-C(2))-methyltransferase RlmN [Bacteroidota bacterium]MCB9257187.1 23S rRNA (adenine(2503)-C(2))-methyltransferase RlmN [Chitinophagales bacterium]